MKATVLVFVLCVVVCGGPARGETIAEFFQINRLEEVVVLRYRTMDTDQPVEASRRIASTRELADLNAVLKKLSSDGRLCADFPDNMPTTVAYLIHDSNMVSRITIFGKSVRAPNAKNGTFGLGDQEATFVRLLLGDRLLKEQDVAVAQQSAGPSVSKAAAIAVAETRLLAETSAIDVDATCHRLFYRGPSNDYCIEFPLKRTAAMMSDAERWSAGYLVVVDALTAAVKEAHVFKR